MLSAKRTIATFSKKSNLSLRHTIVAFLLDRLRFSKLLEILSPGLRSETSPDYAKVSFYFCLCSMNNKDRMTF